MPQAVETLVRQAFEGGQVAALLRGEEPYHCAMDRFTPGNSPTNWEMLLRTGILPYCTGDRDRTAQFYQGVDTLLSGGAPDVWCAFSVYFFLCFSLDEEPQYITMDGFPIDRLRSRLLECREELAACKLWDGAQNPNGLWGEVLRLNTVLRNTLRQGLF